MKVINASWEYRNLKLKAGEIVLDREKSFDIQYIINAEKEFDYLTVKVPVGNLGLIHELEECGFRYVENLVDISKRASEFRFLPDSYIKFLKGSDYQKVCDEYKLGLIIDNVEKGLFNSDRFALDPLWGITTSSLRYSNWIKDMYNNENKEIFLIENDNPLGFFILEKLENKTVNFILGGIFKEARNGFQSHSFIYFALKEAFESGAKIVNTTVSSNNLKVQNLYSNFFSFSIKESHIVLRKKINDTI